MKSIAKFAAAMLMGLVATDVLYSHSDAAGKRPSRSEIKERGEKLAGYTYVGHFSTMSRLIGGSANRDKIYIAPGGRFYSDLFQWDGNSRGRWKARYFGSKKAVGLCLTSPLKRCFLESALKGARRQKGNPFGLK